MHKYVHSWVKQSILSVNINVGNQKFKYHTYVHIIIAIKMHQRELFSHCRYICAKIQTFTLLVVSGLSVNPDGKICIWIPVQEGEASALVSKLLGS